MTTDYGRGRYEADGKGGGGVRHCLAPGMFQTPPGAGREGAMRGMARAHHEISTENLHTVIKPISQLDLRL